MLQGILVDQWKLWEKKAGIAVQYHGADWADALQRMKAGEFDVIAAITETPARREYLDFTPPFATTDVPIFFRKEISGITDLASLRGFPVGVKAGDQRIAFLKANGVTTLVTFESHAAIVRAAAEHKIAVFICDAPSALYYLNKAGLANDFRQTGTLFHDQIRRAVRKGDEAVLRAVVDGFAALSPEELRRIDEKWYGRTLSRYDDYFGYAVRAAAGVLLVVAGLLAWNWLLNVKIRQRTAALRESEQRFRQIAENTDNAIWLATGDSSRVLYINPAYETIWGRSCESLYRDPRSRTAAIHPEDRSAVAEAAARNGERAELEYRLVRPDGAIRWVRERRFAVKDGRGQIYRRAGIAEDITERKRAADALREAEDRIRQFFNAMPIMAWSLTADGTVDFINQRWLDYSGISLEEEVAQPLRTIHPEDVAGVVADWNAAKAAGWPYETEMRLRRADGQYRWFLVRTEPFRDRRGNVTKWFGASVEIEERKQAEEALVHQEQQLRVLVERLQTAREEEAKRIARELHDDLGQQLTALKLQLDCLETTLPGTTPTQSARFGEMYGAVDSMVEVVQSLASELRLGHLDELGLSAAVDWLAKEFSRRSRIPCRLRRLDEVARLSSAQNTAVFRILQEALTNVVRHAGATEVELSLRAKPDGLVLVIRDNGRGVTPAELNGRTAIGVLGMRERAEAAGGGVSISGAAGKGTTVVITMPLGAAALLSS